MTTTTGKLSAAIANMPCTCTDDDACEAHKALDDLAEEMVTGQQSSDDGPAHCAMDDGTELRHRTAGSLGIA